LETKKLHGWQVNGSPGDPSEAAARTPETTQIRGDGWLLSGDELFLPHPPKIVLVAKPDANSRLIPPQFSNRSSAALHRALVARLSSDAAERSFEDA
jgi:hypothetical protein